MSVYMCVSGLGEDVIEPEATVFDSIDQREVVIPTVVLFLFPLWLGRRKASVPLLPRLLGVSDVCTELN
nr:hypothetical protein BaRGS_026476 [Batillaria attramentaria]